VAVAAEPATGEPKEALQFSTVVTVAIISTLKARTHHPNWLLIAQAAVTDANTAFRNSGVNLVYTITRFANLTGYDETNKTFSQMLSDLSAAPGIHSFRDSTRSDLVSFFRDDAGAGSQSCGIGYQPDPPTAATSGQGYSVVNIGCAVSNHSLAHETGHNMGLRHDRYVEHAFGILQNKYNYGFSNVTHRVRTIMSYPDYCNSQRVSCSRVGFFSNPFATSNGGTLGVNLGQRDPANNAQRLRETKAIVAGYR
jgi:hypothetical protein